MTRHRLEAWRATLDSKARISLNHPTTIWRKHPDGRKAEAADKKMAGEGPRKSVARDIAAAADRLHDGVDRMESKLGGADLFDMSPELIGESAKNFVEIFGREGYVAVHHGAAGGRGPAARAREAARSGLHRLGQAAAAHAPQAPERAQGRARLGRTRLAGRRSRDERR